ncbi:putative acyl-CoA desaturase [Helianthus debilis subsp. tardiflorus]
MLTDPIFWVSMHRYHHQYVDSEKDPLSYIWILYQERKNVKDLKKQAFYRFIQRTYLLNPFAFATNVYVFGGFTYLAWVIGVALIWGYHVNFLLNSACYIWRKQAWNTSDLSKNNW